MKTALITIMAATALVAAPASAAPGQMEMPAPTVDEQVAAAAPNPSDYVPMGDDPTEDELNQRGGNPAIAIVVGGTVIAIRSCASNVICRTAAKALITHYAKKYGLPYVQAVYADSRAALDRQLCARYGKRC